MVDGLEGQPCSRSCGVIRFLWMLSGITKLHKTADSKSAEIGYDCVKNVSKNSKNACKIGYVSVTKRIQKQQKCM